MKLLTILLLILTIVITSASVNSALLQTLHCNVNVDSKEITVGSQLKVFINYTNSENAPKEATISCGGNLDVNATCSHDLETQSGTCSATCNYQKGGLYQINGRVATGDCGGVKVEALEVNEQNFEDNAYLEFLLDSNAAQVNVLKVISTPAIIKNDKKQVVNFTTRNRLEITSVKCNSDSNAKNACTCEVTQSDKTRAQVSCTFNSPLLQNYKVKFITVDKKEKTFTVILNAGQAAVVYAPQSSLNPVVIGGVIIVILVVVFGVFHAFKKLETQSNVKSELNASRVKILSEIENLKKSNARGETSDEDLELILVQKNTELEEIEKQIKTQEEKLNEMNTNN